MRNRILGAIGVIWGGGILISRIFKDAPEDAGAYAVGQAVGLVFGGLLFCVGLYFLIRGAGRG